MQVNQALPLLLDLLLEECWDGPDTLEVLLGNLPQPDLRSVLKEASETGCVSSLTGYFVARQITRKQLYSDSERVILQTE